MYAHPNQVRRAPVVPAIIFGVLVAGVFSMAAFAAHGLPRARCCRAAGRGDERTGACRSCPATSRSSPEAGFRWPKRLVDAVPAAAGRLGKGGSAHRAVRADRLMRFSRCASSSRCHRPGGRRPPPEPGPGAGLPDTSSRKRPVGGGCCRSSSGWRVHEHFEMTCSPCSSRSPCFLAIRRWSSAIAG